MKRAYHNYWVYILTNKPNGTLHGMMNCIDREKQLKNWHRQWKINLIEMENPNWTDLWDSSISLLKKDAKD